MFKTNRKMNQFNICVISDIHLKESYAGDGHQVRKVFDSFQQQFLTIHAKEPIDCVVISGDLSFKGDIDEFTKLKEILDDIVPKHIPILSVVGNHDVHWDILKGVLGQGRELPELFKIEKKEFFKGKFNQVFKNFENQFIKGMKNRLHDKNFAYEKGHFAGYYHFPENKVLFLLLNSSWKSFGPGVVGEYYDSYVSDFGDKEIRKELKDFVIGDKLSQRGKQSYFLNPNYYPFWNDINTIKESYPETRIVTVAHHPPSWLEWDEQFSKTEGADVRLDGLLEISDILITGHEHVPMTSEPIKLPKGCHNVQMGSFLDYHFIENEENETTASRFPNNWFSVLKLKSFKCSQENYKLEVKGSEMRGNVEFFWEKRKDSIDFYFRDIANDSAANEKYLEENLDEEQILEFKLPVDSNELKEIIENERKNLFESEFLPAITSGQLIRASINEETYVIAPNTLDGVFDTIGQSEEGIGFSEFLENHPFFKELHDIIDKEEVANLSFYDFIAVRKSKHYEDFYNSQFIKFQSFKHDFFGKFEEFYTFRELNINYDCFITNR